MQLLKQSTAADVPIGPFLDSTDGVSEENGLTIAYTDIYLSKNGAALANKSETSASSNDDLGYYTCSLNSTDTGTLGRLLLACNMSGAVPVWHEFMVVTSNVYDTVCGSDTLEVDMIAIDGNDTDDNSATLFLKQLNIANTTGSAIVATSLGSNGHGIEAAGNGTGSGIETTGGATGHGIDAIGGATTGHGLQATAGNDGSGFVAVGDYGAGASTYPGYGYVAVGNNTGAGFGCLGGSGGGPGILAYGGATNGNGITAAGQGNGNGAALSGAGAGQDISASEIDDILEDTGTTIPGTITTIDGIVDNILVDTGTTLPGTLSTIDGKIDTIDGNVDAILVDTGTTLPGTLSTMDGKIDTIDGIVDDILVDTGTTIPGTITTIDGIVDEILVDTGTTLPGTLSTIDGKIDTVDGNVDAILLDTGTTLPGTLSTIDGNVDAILVDTGTTLPGTLSAMDGKIDTIDGIVDDILVDTGTTLPGTLTTIEGKIDTIDGNVDTLVSGQTTMNGKLDDIEGATFDTATDSLEAIRNRGDSAWVTGSATSANQTTIINNLATVDGIVDAILVDTAEIGTAGAGLTDLGGMSTGMKAEVESEVNDALVAIDLDHLAKTSYVGAKPTVGTLFDSIMNKSGLQNFDRTQDSLEAIRDKVDDVEADTQNIQGRIPAALVGGYMSSDAVAISGSTTAADNVEANIANLDAAISSRSDFDETADPVELLDSGGSAGTSAAELVVDIFAQVLSELTQAKPDATPTFSDAVMMLYMALRNRVDVDMSGGTDYKEFYNDAGSIVYKKAVSDDGTTYTEAEMESGA